MVMTDDAQLKMRISPAESIIIKDTEVRFWSSPDRPPPSDDRIIFMHKSRQFVSRIDAVLEKVQPRRMVEIGILDGGSTIYWQARYQPQCLIAFELACDAPCLSHYLERHHLTDTVHTYFGVSQADSVAVRSSILKHTQGQPIDIVIDDASHQYAETRASVETLLPFMRPAGVYIIEDWAWGHDAKWPADLWVNQPLLSPLLVELTLICGHQTGVIEKIEIDPSFVAFWRGEAPLRRDGGFRLSDHYAARGFSLNL
jgi:Methyltransferase domain